MPTSWEEGKGPGLNQTRSTYQYHCSLVLNPERKYYQQLKDHLYAGYEDTYFNEDAIFLERNSRDFLRRTHRIDANTLLVATLLHTHSQRVSESDRVVKRVWYPVYETRECYDLCRVRASPDGRRREGGYGGLLSVTFTSQTASQAFFDALRCAKGPSLGTNFTLACPYTILAHYAELDWAQGWGVEKELVRISVGLEDPDDLLKIFGDALDAAVKGTKQ
jgi:cystathionine gamma-synthase